MERLALEFPDTNLRDVEVVAGGLIALMGWFWALNKIMMILGDREGDKKRERLKEWEDFWNEK